MKPAPHAIMLPIDATLPRRWIVGEESGDCFLEDDDFDGITLTLELHGPAEARAVAMALSAALPPRIDPPAGQEGWA